MKFLKNFFQKWKDKFLQNPLLYTLRILTAVLLIVLVTFGVLIFFTIRQSESSYYLQEQYNRMLRTAIKAEKIIENKNHYYYSLVDTLNLPDDFAQLWLSNPEGETIFCHDESTLRLMQNIYDNSVHYSLSDIQGEYTSSKNYNFYSIPLSDGYKIFFVLKNIKHTDNLLLVVSELMLLLLIITVLILYHVFKKNIYLPIHQLEHAMIIQPDGQLTFDLSAAEKNELHFLAKKMNAMFENTKELISQKYNTQLLYKQAEINALQSQINPHFLYNTLDSIRGQALMQNSYEIAGLLKSLSNIFRYSISQRESIVTLSEELNHLTNYLNIQQYRFKDKFEFSIEFAENSSSFLNYPIPKLTIQPIVENALFHGLETKKGKGEIHFYAYRTSTQLIIEIKDNGNGMDDATLLKLNEKLNTPVDVFQEASHDAKRNHQSIALQNVNQRIKLNYGNNYGLLIYSTLGVGTTVQIQLPTPESGEE